MKRFTYPFLLLGILLTLLFFFGENILLVNSSSFDGIGVPSEEIQDSTDFATLVFRDPWDMQEYSDISQYLNLAGQTEYISNMQVENGIFSATTVSDPNFFVFFPGYETAIHPDSDVAKPGSRYPIDPSKYGCFYLAMYAEVKQRDYYQLMWFADDRLNGGGNSNWGLSEFIPIYFPEFSMVPPGGGFWKLYKFDLRSAQVLIQTTPWLQKSAWQGIRIDPVTISTGTNFKVAWARLTTCYANYQTITWTPDASLRTLWLRPVDQNNWIRVDQVSGSSGLYSLDVQGIEPGKYEVGFSNLTYSCCSVRSEGSLLKINQTPIVNFTRPSYISGVDFAEQGGNPWDFADDSDIKQLNHFKSTSVHDGVLDLVTATGVNGDLDVQVELSLPAALIAGEYRYFTFRMFTYGANQEVPEATIVRFIWVIPSKTGIVGYECWLVSQDVPYDIGWREVTVDLWEPFAGSAEDSAPIGPPHCPSLPFDWSDSGKVIRFRFDPNENMTGHDLHQLIDWIKLTKEDQIIVGSSFPIQMVINKSLDELQSLVLYYTDTLNEPTQHLIGEYPLPGSFPTPTPNPRPKTYLPVIIKNYQSVPSPLPNEVRYWWETRGVLPGRYYICAEIGDGLNQATYCSKAPILVVAP